MSDPLNELWERIQEENEAKITPEEIAILQAKIKQRLSQEEEEPDKD